MELAFAGVSHVHMNDFINLVHRLPDVQITAIWDPDRERAHSAAHRLNCSVASDIREILSNPATTALVIASQTRLHAAHVEHAVKARKHLFVEKPLGINADETAKLADLIKESGLLFHTGFFLRELPAIQSLKSLLAAGRFGSLENIHLSYSHPGLARGWLKDSWLLNEQDAGGGALLDLGLHCVDLIEYVTGNQIQSINAVTGRLSDFDTNVADHYASVTAQLGQYDIPASFYVGWADDPTLESRFKPKGARLVVKMGGSRASALFTDKKAYFNDKETKETIELDMRQPAAADGLKTFLDALATRDNSRLASLSSVKRASMLIEAAYCAAQRDNRSLTGRNHKSFVPIATR